MFRIFWLGVGCLGTFYSLAQDDRALTSTDRPGFGDGTAIMAPGGIQLEAGATHTDIEDVEVTNFGELLFRIGISRWFELRVLANSYVELGDPFDESGLEDSGLGFKVGILAGDDEPMGKPSLSFIGGVSLETGDEPFTTDDTVVSGALAWSWQLAENLGHAAYLGVEEVDDEHLTTFSTSLAFDWIGAGWSVGYGGFFADEGDDAHFVEANAAIGINPRNQIDINAGVGLNSDNDGFFVGAGYAYRF